MAIIGSAALAYACAGGLAPFALAAAGCPVCGHNLIENPGAESAAGAVGDDVVKVPGWTGSGGFTAGRYAWSSSDVSATSPGPPARGKNYFYGGPAAPLSSGSQTVSLAAGAAAINTGNIRATLSGWLGGYSTQRDQATLTVSFLGASGQVLGILRIGPVTEAERKGVSGLLDRSATTGVPKGSTSAKLSLVMTRTDGSDNDGLADNLSLMLAAATGGSPGGGGGTPTVPTGGSTPPASGTTTGTVLVNGRPFTSGAIPYGSKIDVTNGTLLLQTDTGKLNVFGRGVSAKFQFLRGTDNKKAIVELRLTGGDFSVCKRKTSSASATATIVRQLWGNGKGRFRTRGRYAAATVRGTFWLTADRCDGTLTQVNRGVIQVSDLPLRRQITVRAGKSYLAKP